MALQYPDIIESSNPKAYGIVKAKEVSGHKTVNSVEDLYELADCILSESGNNSGNDAIGQEWYVISESAKYKLINWENKGESSGWKKIEDAVNITVDSSLSDSSTNPVQNKVIKSELDKKQDTLVSSTNIKTINGESILGSGDLEISEGIQDAPADGKKYVRSNNDWVEETTVDTSSFATKSELSGKLDTSTYTSDKATFATKEELEGKVDDSEIADMLTKTEASSTYATKTEVTEGLGTKQDKGDYALKSEIPDISNLATKQELSGKLDTSTYTSDKETFATKTELEGKVDDSEIADMLTKTEASSTYATKAEIPEEYTLPIASASTLGGIKVGAGLSINSGTGVLSATGGGVADSVDWENITSKPETFKPEAHQHVSADITDLQEKLDSKQDTLVSATNIKTINGESILGSGNIEVSTNITVDDSLSTSSTNPVQNKIITAKLNELDDKVNPLSVQVTGGGTFEKGTTQTITVRWVVKKGDKTTTADSVTVNDEPAEGDNKQFTEVKTTTTYTVKVTKNEKQVQGSTTATFIAPMYFGFAAEAEATSLNIESLGKQSIKTSPNGSYTLNNSTSGHYLWLCVPNTMTINKVTSGGFDVPMEASQEGTTSVDTYKCYRSSSSINQGDMNIVIS